MHENSEKYFCKLLEEDIRSGICSQIKMLRTGFYHEELLDTVKQKTEKKDSEIIEVCKGCPRFS